MLTSCITGSTYYMRYNTYLSQPIFASSALCIQMIEAIRFYTYSDASRFSRNFYVRDEFLKDKRSTLLAFCLLPHEYHILLQQNEDNGIYQTIKRTHESITRYYNSLFKREGKMFDSKNVRIEYIYPELQAFTIKQIEELPMYVFQRNWKLYPWSSFHERQKLRTNASIGIRLVSKLSSFPSRLSRE